MTPWQPRRVMTRLIRPGEWVVRYLDRRPGTMPASYEPATLEARHVAMRKIVDAREDDHLAIRVLAARAEVAGEIDAFLWREGYVADPSDIVLEVEVRAKVKAWPVHEGVTT